MNKFDCGTFIDIKSSYNIIDGKIHIESTISTDDMVNRLSYRVIELEDVLIKQALIELGWTPPNE